MKLPPGTEQKLREWLAAQGSYETEDELDEDVADITALIAEPVEERFRAAAVELMAKLCVKAEDAGRKCCTDSLVNAGGKLRALKPEGGEQ